MKCIVINNQLVEESKTLVPWWSFGKTVLATCILKLVEKGQLSLDKSYYGLQGNLEQLLRHETGLKDYYSKIYEKAVANNEIPWSFADLLEKTNSKHPIAKAGKQFYYSNIGYYYIKKLVEETTSMTFKEAIYDLFFEQLGINDVFLAKKPEELNVGVVGTQKGYQPGWLYHGMLIGSLNSACTFLHNLALGKFISLNMIKKMKDAYMIPFDIGNRPWQKPGYGLGIMLDAKEGPMQCFGHTGSGPGSTIAVYHFPNVKGGITVAATSESSDQSIVENKVTDIVKSYL